MRAVKDDIIVKKIFKDKEGSILIPDTAKDGSGEFYGDVVSVGPENTTGVKEGDKVLFTRHEGFEISSKGEKFYRLRQLWVLAVVA